ncbi:hypothetical protein [Euzebya tangerina]|uniref:hypothetical protein n=1 Tax=Euzebya tangerina TaxID=591198 RepID=UPI0013C2F10C|nr:hypothetical protein [Euzebya tangerina]
MRADVTRLVVTLLLGLGLVGCQITDPEGQVTIEASDDQAGPEEEPALGSPEEEWPRTIPALRAAALPEAQIWQDEPVLADLVVFMTDGRWDSVRLTYVAPDAERMLVYRSAPDDLRLERPLLEGLQLPSIPALGVELIDPFPEDALEPIDLAAAAAPALADCDAEGEEVRAVLYATGAPATWDGSTWTRLPSWRATVVTESVGVVVDPLNGQAFAPLTCVEPLLLGTE